MKTRKALKTLGKNAVALVARGRTARAKKIRFAARIAAAGLESAAAYARKNRGGK